jgi:hypothetical protein
MPYDSREQTNEQKSFKNCTPSRAPGHFCPNGFPRLCSLSFVICLFFAMLDAGKHTNHDKQRAHTGETFWAKRAWRCRRVRFLRFLAAAGNLPPQDTKLAPKRGPASAPRAPKRTPKTATFHPRPQKDTQKGPQISTQGTRRSSKNKISPLRP